MARIIVDDELVEEIKKEFPELTRLNATDIVDWALRKQLRCVVNKLE